MNYYVLVEKELNGGLPVLIIPQTIYRGTFGHSTQRVTYSITNSAGLSWFLELTYLTDRPTESVLRSIKK